MPELVTDRLGLTEAPVLVPKGALQVKTGFQIESDNNGTIESCGIKCLAKKAGSMHPMNRAPKKTNAYGFVLDFEKMS